MNPELNTLRAYPFQRLTELLGSVENNTHLSHIALSIGEPKHSAPDFIRDVLMENVDGISSYPKTTGETELREAIREWLIRRFDIQAEFIDAGQHILPVNGTREALFSIAQAVINRQTDPLVMLPNPFYQIYEGAALLSGAETCFMACEAKNNFLPDLQSIPTETWRRCQLLYICTPSNPAGAVMDTNHLQTLVELAHTHNFIIASDECYSEIYSDEQNPPTGLLGVAEKMGLTDFSHCIVFHSLSKRSNVPGLRSGFVAGDANIIKPYLQYRTYHGCAMSPPTQAVSAALWRDERHVKENRALYREKFEAVLEILSPVLSVDRPAGGFYLWPQTPEDDQLFARRLFELQHVTVLPGSYLSRTIDGNNPGKNRVRMALVAPLDQCIDAANRIRDYLQTH